MASFTLWNTSWKFLTPSTLNLSDVGGDGGRGRECSSHSCPIFSFISSSLTSLNPFCSITCPPREEKRRTYLYIFIVVLCLSFLGEVAHMQRICVPHCPQPWSDQGYKGPAPEKEDAGGQHCLWLSGKSLYPEVYYYEAYWHIDMNQILQQQLELLWM